MIGQTVGHYKILDRLGAGGMGEVYRARDTRLKRIVALKLLPPRVAGSQERLQRFRREAEAVAALNHPNIVMIHSVEEVDGLHFITMELIEGKPLHHVIPRGGLPLRRYFELAVPLVEALAAAHEKGVVHRDLKPDNIMVGDRGVVKVLDFGLAKLVSPELDSTTAEQPTETLTLAGQIYGTVPYMSPEQVRGQEVDHQSDIFSLGIVLHEMATGSRLFRGESSADTVSAILTIEPVAIAEVRTDLPFHLSRIVSHCLVKDRAHRYQSSQDLRDELVELKREVDSGQIRSGRISTGESGRSSGLAARSKRKIVTWGLSLVALTVAVALAWIVSRDRGSADRYGSDMALAVMPLTNLTGDPSQSYVGDGLSAGLINRLSEVGGLSVVGRSETWSLRGKQLSASQIGKELGVDVVVEGGVMMGEGLRADVSLIDARSGRVLRSESFVGDRSRLIEMQAEMARQLIRVLSIPLSSRERRRLAKQPTVSGAAYEFYLQGQEYLEDVDNPDGAEFARDLFREAARVDPEFALAYAGLSDALWRIAQRGQDGTTLERAEKEAMKALELDPELPAAQVALARVYRSTGRYAESIGQLRQILLSHPNPAEAHRQLAYSYEAAGDLDAAEESLRYAIALKSDDWHLWNSLGAFLVKTTDYDAARDAFERAASLAPADMTWPRENLASLSILEGKPETAVALFEAIENPSDDPKLLANIGTAYYFLDRLDESERYYLQALQLRPDSATEHGNLADLYLRQGRPQEAQQLYGEALDLVEKGLDANPRDNELKVDQALYAAKAGQCAKASRLADRLADDVPEIGHYHHSRAVAYALCGEHDATFEALAKSIALGIAPDLIRQEDEFQQFSADPAFLEIVGDGL